MILLALLATLLPLSCSELLFVSVIWRHGDRAPSALPYPNDVHGEHAWPRGWQQLTDIGMNETHELGKWLHQRYVSGANKHIRPIFNRSEVLVRSSDSERALTSAQCVMAALFRPTSKKRAIPEIDWIPTPIHSNGEDNDDPLLKPTKMLCPAYDSLKMREREPLLKSLNSENEQLFASLSNHTGNNITCENAAKLYDITREMRHGLAQPDWVDDDLVEQLTELKRRVRLNEFDTQEKARFRGGFLLGDWHARINAAARGAEDALKTVMYSSHDGTLSALLYTMGVANGQLVPYAAAVIVELHREKGVDAVQLWYRNSSHAAPYPLALPNCTHACPLAEFNRLVAPLTINSTQQLTELCSSVSSTLTPSLYVSALIYLILFLDSQ